MREDLKGTRPGPFLAGHCSLQWVGIVYARLGRHFGRDRIVVIAQLSETLSWLRQASADEASAKRLAGKESLLPMLRTRLAETEAACAQLIADGGADYDGPDVNAGTVLRVLSGEGRAGSKSVPQEGVGSVMLVMVSHGHAHPAGPGTRHHEWYMHFPHPVRAEDDTYYEIVAHCGFEEVDPNPEWNWGAPKHHFKLYSQMLFQAHHAVLERAPRRRLVLFHQFCLSGGAANFMRQRNYQLYCGTRRWPVYAVVTAGRFEPALGNFVGLWSEELAAALRAGGGRTLGDVYSKAEGCYWGASPELRASNAEIAAAKRACLPPAAGASLGSASGELGEEEDDPVTETANDESERSTVGTVGREAGFDASFGISMEDLPVRHLVNCIDGLCSQPASQPAAS